MKVYQKTINYKYDGEKFKLVCFSDVHIGAANCALDDFREMLKQHGKKPNRLLIDIGDACDFVSPHDKRYRVSSIHPLFRNEDSLVDAQINYYCNEIKNYVDKDKFLGIVSGNHHDSILKYYSTDPTQRIASKLGVPNLGYCFFYRLLFKREGKGYQTLLLYGHHGYGGGSRTEGYNLTKFARNASFIDADIFLYGHTHDKWGKRIIRVTERNGKVQEIPMVVANCGTFLRTLAKDEVPSYSEAKGFPPRDIGYVIIEITTPTEEKPFFDLRVML